MPDDPTSDAAHGEPARSEAGRREAGAGGTAPTEHGAVADGSRPRQVDVGRRNFFRLLASDALNAAATIVGAANVLQRESAEAAASLLGGETEPAPVTGPATPARIEPPSGFRSPFRFEGDRLILVDQRELPSRLVEVECRTGPEVARAIRDMVIRGAPAIGQAAAYGLALTAAAASDAAPYHRLATIRGTANALTHARPTAVNARWAMDRMIARFEAIGTLSEDGAAIAAALREEAEAIAFETMTAHARLADAGLTLLPPPPADIRVLTHCNTGPLACGQVGTALGVVQLARQEGRKISVFVDETRPWLQGSRLTAWELAQAEIPHWVIADSAAGWLMARGEVDAVLVGADRVAANGDTANKIGTYTLAVMAARHGVPFYVCAPTSSVDLATPSGAQIDIEERSALEVLHFHGERIAPRSTMARNPSFDVTPAELITAIVTDEGVVRPAYDEGLAAAVLAAHGRRPGRAQQAATTATTATAATAPASVAQQGPPPGPPAEEADA